MLRPAHPHVVPEPRTVRNRPQELQRPVYVEPPVPPFLARAVTDLDVLGHAVIADGRHVGRDDLDPLARQEVGALGGWPLAGEQEFPRLLRRPGSLFRHVPPPNSACQPGTVRVCFPANSCVKNREDRWAMTKRHHKAEEGLDLKATEDIVPGQLCGIHEGAGLVFPTCAPDHPCFTARAAVKKDGMVHLQLEKDGSYTHVTDSGEEQPEPE